LRAGAGRYGWIWAPAAVVAVWALLRVLGIDRGFPLAAMMPFTPYVAIAALLVAGLAVALENWAAAALAGLATVYLGATILPRTVGDGTVAAAGEPTVRVLSANIHRGTADPRSLVELVDRLDPDVLAVQELTPKADRALRAAGLTGRLPHSLIEVRAGSAGSGIYTRLSLRRLPSSRRFVLRMPRAELAAADGRRLRLVDVHPFPPQRHRVGEWEAALRSLPSAGGGTPWLLAGDFNATLDQSQLRDVVGRGYRDAAAVAGKGLEPTFPRQGHAIPPIPPITIDHVLADRRLGVVEYSVEDLPGSDHRAVFAVLALPGAGRDG